MATLKVKLDDNLGGQPLVLSDAAVRLLAEMVVNSILREQANEAETGSNPQAKRVQKQADFSK